MLIQNRPTPSLKLQPARAQSAASQPKFSGDDRDDIGMGDAIGVLIAGGIWTVASPFYGVHKATEAIQADSFKRILKRKNADDTLTKQFPDTAQDNQDLHERLRWLAKAAAKGGKSQVKLFKKALELPRVQTLLKSEYSAAGNGTKKTLEAKIREHGHKNPNGLDALLDPLKQLQNWIGFERDPNTAAFRQALAEGDVRAALAELKGEMCLCWSDRQDRNQGHFNDLEAISLSNRLNRPYNFNIFSRALGGDEQADDFVQDILAAEKEESPNLMSHEDRVDELLLESGTTKKHWTPLDA